MVNNPQLIHTGKWKFDYIICRKQKTKKKNKKLNNTFVPKYVSKNLEW